MYTLQTRSMFIIFLAILGVCAQQLNTRDTIISRLKNSVQNNQTRLVHVIVALCDNRYQGIVPVADLFGDGDDAACNLYWGAAYGVKTFLLRSPQWQLITSQNNVSECILERCIFKHPDREIYLVADAYRGKEIKRAIHRFLEVIAGVHHDTVFFECDSIMTGVDISTAHLAVYVGHNGLMDFELESVPYPDYECLPRDVMILACASRQYFSRILTGMNVYPLVWTKALCAPEAYVLEAGLRGWLALEDESRIIGRVVNAYATYQKCSVKAAKCIFTGGW
jgi:hypothetical protein